MGRIPGRVLGVADPGGELRVGIAETAGGELAVERGGPAGGGGEGGLGGGGVVFVERATAEPVIGAGLGDGGFGEGGQGLEVALGGGRVAEATQGDEAGEEFGVRRFGAGGLALVDDGVGAGCVAFAQPAAGDDVPLRPEGGAVFGRGGAFGAGAKGEQDFLCVLVLVAAAEPAGEFEDQRRVELGGGGQGGEEGAGGGVVALEGQAGFGGGALCWVEPGDLAPGGAVDGAVIGPGEAVEAAPLVGWREDGAPFLEEGGFAAHVGDTREPGLAGDLGSVRSAAGLGVGVGAAQQGGDLAGGLAGADVQHGGEVAFRGDRLLQAMGHSGPFAASRGSAP